MTVRHDQPLIGLVEERGNQPVVRYFTDEEDADATSNEQSIQRALELAGAWKDLDWAEAAEDFDRIRHGSVPTPPVDLDL
jgi:hypothetical protein